MVPNRLNATRNGKAVKVRQSESSRRHFMAMASRWSGVAIFAFVASTATLYLHLAPGKTEFTELSAVMARSSLRRAQKVLNRMDKADAALENGIPTLQLAQYPSKQRRIRGSHHVAKITQLDYNDPNHHEPYDQVGGFTLQLNYEVRSQQIDAGYGTTRVGGSRCAGPPTIRRSSNSTGGSRGAASRRSRVAESPPILLSRLRPARQIR